MLFVFLALGLVMNVRLRRFVRIKPGPSLTLLRCGTIRRKRSKFRN